MPLDTLTIFSDGACAGNPGPGGWAARLLYGDGRIRELGGFAPDTTISTDALRGLGKLEAKVTMATVQVVFNGEIYNYKV